MDNPKVTEAGGGSSDTISQLCYEIDCLHQLYQQSSAMERHVLIKSITLSKMGRIYVAAAAGGVALIAVIALATSAPGYVIFALGFMLCALLVALVFAK